MKETTCKIGFKLHTGGLIHPAGRDGGKETPLVESVDGVPLETNVTELENGITLIEIKNYKDGNLSPVKIEREGDKEYCASVCSSHMHYCQLLDRGN